MNSSISDCGEPDMLICSSSELAFMVTCTLTTAGVTFAARSDRSCNASPAMAGGAVTRGTITAGATSAVLSARAARIRDFVLVILLKPPACSQVEYGGWVMAPPWLEH